MRGGAGGAARATAQTTCQGGEVAGEGGGPAWPTNASWRPGTAPDRPAATRTGWHGPSGWVGVMGSHITWHGSRAPPAGQPLSGSDSNARTEPPKERSAKHASPSASTAQGHFGSEEVGLGWLVGGGFLVLAKSVSGVGGGTGREPGLCSGMPDGRAGVCCRGPALLQPVEVVPELAVQREVVGHLDSGGGAVRAAVFGHGCCQVTAHEMARG